MIIYKNKGFETRSDMPDKDWTGEALYVVPDGSELAEKIAALYPYYDFILDKDGQLIDVIETERPEPAEQPQPKPTIEEEVAALKVAVQMLCLPDKEVS